MPRQNSAKTKKKTSTDVLAHKAMPTSPKRKLAKKIDPSTVEEYHQCLGSRTTANSKMPVVEKQARGARPTLQRDLLIEFGEQVVVRQKYLDSTTFKFLSINKLIREAALNKLSKLTVLQIDGSMGKLSEKNSKERNYLYIDFEKEKMALKWLKQLIETMMAEFKIFITEVHINAICSTMNVPELSTALRLLKGVTVLSFPYELQFFKPAKQKVLKQLINTNASTLNIIRHINDPNWVPEQLRKRLSMVNASTLRNGSMTVQQDFLAFYGHGANCVHIQPINDAVVMKMSIHRLHPIFTHPKWHTNMVTHFQLRVVNEFGAASALSFLSNLHQLKDNLPMLKQLDVEMVTMDMDPTLEDDLFGDTHHSLVPCSSRTVSEIAKVSLDWMRRKSLPFQLNLTTLLTVDFERNSLENDLLASAANETSRFFDEFNMQIRCEKGSSHMASRTLMEDGESYYELRLEFRIISFVERPSQTDQEEIMFRNEYCCL